MSDSSQERWGGAAIRKDCRTAAHFVTTYWTTVRAAQEGDADALARLAQRYTDPIYAFFKRKGETAQGAEDLTQTLLLKIIGSTWAFSADDFVDMKSLAQSLLREDNKVSQFLNSHFSTALKQLLADYPSEGSGVQTLPEVLVKELDRVICGLPIYEEQRFADVKLSSEATSLLTNHVKDRIAVRLNRVLLEEAYSGMISRRQHGKILGTDPRMGRLRTWIIRCAEHLWIDNLRKRRPEAPFDPDNPPVELGTEKLAEQEFDRRWAEKIVENALKRLAAEVGEGNFRLVEPFVSPSASPSTYDHVAQSMGLSANALKTAVFRARERFRRLVREEVAQTVTESADLESELRELMRVLSS